MPPLRCFILGGKSSGKTIIGRHLAKKFGIFHISFRELLQEEILAKMKKPPLVDNDEWDDTGNNLQQVSGTVFVFNLYSMKTKLISKPYVHRIHPSGT